MAEEARMGDVLSGFSVRETRGKTEIRICSRDLDMFD